MAGKGIYLREKDEYVGPFYSREDAERFLVLMELSGESREGIEVVEIENAAKTVSKAVSVKERQQLLDKATQNRSRGSSSGTPEESTAKSSRRLKQDKNPH